MSEIVDNGSKPEPTPSAPNNSELLPVPFATAALVLGIISIPTCFCYGVPGLITGIICIVLSGKGKKEYEYEPEKYKVASYNNLKAGRICGIIGTSLSAFWLVYVIVILAFAATSVATPFMF